jgi:prolipoprotein diacylglyceryltransferase
VSAGLSLVAFVALLRMFLRPHRDGAVFCAFLLFYGALRLGMAPLRQEALRSMVAFSTLFVVVGTVGLLLGRRAVATPATGARQLRPAR